MKGEIDKDFYCSAGFYQAVPNSEMGYCLMLKGSCGKICPAYQRKWLTPEQFQDKWDKKWDGGVYAICEHRESCHDNCHEDWMLRECVDDAMDDICQADQKAIIVCACTPWGKPHADWRPE